MYDEQDIAQLQSEAEYFMKANNDNMREMHRLRLIVRDYNAFYKRVSAAFLEKNWEAISSALKDFE